MFIGVIDTGTEEFEFSAFTRAEVVDEMVRWLENEWSEKRFDPEAMHTLLELHSEIRFGGSDFDTLFQIHDLPRNYLARD